MNRTDISMKQWEIPTLRKVVMGSDQSNLVQLTSECTNICE